jgi:putative transposase
MVKENYGDTIKTQPKQGNSRFYAYASIYLILRNKRLHISCEIIFEGETLKDTVDFLIKEI